jgi:hypothetical protein
MQGTPNNSNGNSRVLDLNALLAERRLDPVEVKLGDETYMVNTDLTGRETQTFLTLLRTDHEASAFTLLVGTPADRKKVLATADRATSTAARPPKAHASGQGEALNAFIDGLPRMHQALVSGQLMRASRALAEFAKTDDQIYETYGYGLEQPGESTAS